jgi:hypothetical protein
MTSRYGVAAYITLLPPSSRRIALMMEAASTSETSVNFYQTTRHNNPGKPGQNRPLRNQVSKLVPPEFEVGVLTTTDPILMNKQVIRPTSFTATSVSIDTNDTDILG